MSSFKEFRQRREADDAEPARVVEMALPVPAKRFQGERAGFVTRAIASMIDVLVVAVVVVAIWAGLWLAFLIIDPTDSVRPPGMAAVAVIGFPLMWLYWTVSWATSGRSLGAYAMGLRVVSHSGERLAWSTAAIRSVFCLLFPIGLLWVIVSRSNRSLQDVVLRTSAIHDWVVEVPSSRS